MIVKSLQLGVALTVFDSAFVSGTGCIADWRECSVVISQATWWLREVAAFAPCDRCVYSDAVISNSHYKTKLCTGLQCPAVITTVKVTLVSTAVSIPKPVSISGWLGQRTLPCMLSVCYVIDLPVFIPYRGRRTCLRSVSWHWLILHFDEDPLTRRHVAAVT